MDDCLVIEELSTGSSSLSSSLTVSVSSHAHIQWLTTNVGDVDRRKRRVTISQAWRDKVVSKAGGSGWGRARQSCPGQPASGTDVLPQAPQGRSLLPADKPSERCDIVFCLAPLCSAYPFCVPLGHYVIELVVLGLLEKIAYFCITSWSRRHSHVEMRRLVNMTLDSKFLYKDCIVFVCLKL